MGEAFIEVGEPGVKQLWIRVSQIEAVSTFRDNFGKKSAIAMIGGTDYVTTHDPAEVMRRVQRAVMIP